MADLHLPFSFPFAPEKPASPVFALPLFNPKPSLSLPSPLSLTEKRGSLEPEPRRNRPIRRRAILSTDRISLRSLSPSRSPLAIGMWVLSSRFGFCVWFLIENVFWSCLDEGGKWLEFPLGGEMWLWKFPRFYLGMRRFFARKLSWRKLFWKLVVRWLMSFLIIKIQSQWRKRVFSLLVFVLPVKSSLEVWLLSSFNISTNGRREVSPDKKLFSSPFLSVWARWKGGENWLQFKIGLWAAFSAPERPVCLPLVFGSRKG